MHWFECTTAELCRVTLQGPMRLVNLSVACPWGVVTRSAWPTQTIKKTDYSQLSIDLSGTWMNIGGKKVDS